MDRSCTSEPNHSTAMRTVGSAALELLLSAAAGERRKPASASSAGPVVSEAPVLRQPQNGFRAGSKPQENPAPDVYPGYRSPLSKTESKPAGAWSPNLSVLVARRGNPPTQPRLEHRYYLPSDAWRLSLLGRGDGLVQSVRAQLGTLQHLGDQLLPNRARRRVPLRPTRNLEFRSGFAVHLLRVPGPAPKAWHLDQHGWPWPRPRQCFHRTAVAFAQVRTNLSRRLCHRTRSLPGVARLFPLLQLSAPAPGVGLSDIGRSVPAQIQKEEVTFLMRALPSSSRDLPLLLPEWMLFALLQMAACRTLEMLARGTGLRGDATRAPMQVRNGWRPHRRHLTQPASPSKDEPIFCPNDGVHLNEPAQFRRTFRDAGRSAMVVERESCPRQASTTCQVEGTRRYRGYRLSTSAWAGPQAHPHARQQ